MIRALLVPAMMRLFGDWNWWLPRWAAKALFPKSEPTPPPAAESA